MVNIIAQGFENVNKIGLDCQSSRLSTHFSHLFHLITALSTPAKQHKKIALLKSKALLERVRGIAPPSPFRKKSILVIEINPQKYEVLTHRKDFLWSGLRGSNSLPPPWQGGALPDELNPHLVLPDGIEPSTRGFSVLCSTD